MKHKTNMNNTQQLIDSLQQQIDSLQQVIARLKVDLEALSGEYYRNNFSGTQDFNKSCRFNTGLKVPSYATTPTNTSEVGQLIEVGGKLYICTASTPTWVVAGTQS